MNVLQFLWICSAPVLLVTGKELWFEPKPRTWEEAQNFCRSHNGELATVESNAEVTSVGNRSVFHAWFGLRNLDHLGWSWDNGIDQTQSKDVFAKGQPGNGYNCGKIIRGQNKAYTDDCDTKLFFFCECPHDHQDFHFFPEAKTWAEALEYCLYKGLKFMDFRKSDTFYDQIIWDWQDYPVWIGLHHEVAWSWSDGTPYRSFWFTESAEDYGPGYCGAVSSDNGHMLIHKCSQAFPFFCQGHKQEVKVVLVEQLLTWEQGLKVCRNMSSSLSNFTLISLEESQMKHVRSLTKGATAQVWVGSRFLAGSWFWSDGTNLSLPTLPSCPESTLHCGALDISTSSIEPADCSKELNVLCDQT